MTSHNSDHRFPLGVLLAAGHGVRFDPSGRSDKLRQTLLLRGKRRGIAQHAAHSLVSALPGCGNAVAVIAPGRAELAAELAACEIGVLECPVADGGIGSVLAWAVDMLPPRPLLVCLGDMPWLRSTSILMVAAALDEAMPVAACFGGQRGHPVGFPVGWRDRLRALSGARGAGSLLDGHGWRAIDIDDPGIVRDVDFPADLTSCRES